ncbi:MEKHLA domain-containing protein [Bordetella genomosp. 9]|uniref:MEKHLA domain-containing protein n=1 Tax=Bordetella genomosp. 9 TaxID=1416803 RepID=UPI000B9E45BA|nr:MEKHLA domain-containing protein [Bordetella genomosp. 9]
MDLPLYADPAFIQLLRGSHERLLGRPLLPRPMEARQAAHWLYEEAPFEVLAHDTGADPRFIYGNKAAQRRFEYDWDELTRLPSRLSAEAPNREERERFLERVRRTGFESGYCGIRITKTGKRFLIEQATLWELRDDDGGVHGQAVVIPRTSDL